MEKAATFVVALSFAFLSVLLWQATRSQEPLDPVVDGVEAPESLLEHTKEFGTPEIIHVSCIAHGQLFCLILLCSACSEIGNAYLKIERKYVMITCGLA